MIVVRLGWAGLMLCSARPQRREPQRSLVVPQGWDARMPRTPRRLACHWLPAGRSLCSLPPCCRPAASPRQTLLRQSADELGAVLHAALDFINCHVPPKPCVPEPRTFIGEVRMPRGRSGGGPAGVPA